jgi:hypothetical protein
MLGILGTHVLMKKKGEMSLSGESQFDTQLSQHLQLINAAWPVKLQDDVSIASWKKIMESYCVTAA